MLTRMRPVTVAPSRAHAENLAARDWLLLLALTAGAVLIHGYHGGAEDAEIYLPGVLKHLNPALFPRNSEFFNSHAGLTVFPLLISESIRVMHLPTGIVVLLWQVASIFALFFACFRVARVYFHKKHIAWCGVAMIASLLTLPVAGTALYIMDQYVTSRSLSTAASMLALASFLERKRLAAAGWVAFTAAVHPLMSLFLLVFLGMALFMEAERTPAPAFAALAPLALFPPITRAYGEVLHAHPYFLLTNWAWYEWLGIFGPLAILGAAAFAMRYSRFGPMARLLKALAAFELFFLGCALFISVPGPLERFAEIQPMRCLLLIYILLFLLGGCLLGEFVLRQRVWLWALVFVPLCGGMAVAQINLFPDSHHIEYPWRPSGNSWVDGFDWIRTHTPQDAYFALDPDYERLPGEDVHGFRAIAQRGMMADNGKDSGAVSMFPALAVRWSEQVEARRSWKQFQRPDFLRLSNQYHVNWVVLQQPGARGLTCPYQNSRILVCRVD
jgi:hypothetical protein